MLEFGLFHGRTKYAKAFAGVDIRQIRPKVNAEKKKICEPSCGELMPRSFEFPQNGCGFCLSLTRDVVLEWSKVEKRGNVTAWRILQDVCEDTQLRHPEVARDEVREFCEDTVEEHGSVMVPLMVNSLKGAGMLYGDQYFQFEQG